MSLRRCASQPVWCHHGNFTCTSCFHFYSLNTQKRVEGVQRTLQTFHLYKEEYYWKVLPCIKHTVGAGSGLQPSGLNFPWCTELLSIWKHSLMLVTSSAYSLSCSLCLLLMNDVYSWTSTDLHDLAVLAAVQRVELIGFIVVWRDGSMRGRPPQLAFPLVEGFTGLGFSAAQWLGQRWLQHQRQLRLQQKTIHVIVFFRNKSECHWVQDDSVRSPTFSLCFLFFPFLVFDSVTSACWPAAFSLLCVSSAAEALSCRIQRKRSGFGEATSRTFQNHTLTAQWTANDNISPC